MRQILYVSMSAVRGSDGDVAGILQQSRHNNAIDGITGLLWSDGTHFLQVFEGPEASVAAAWERIQADPRHRDVTLLHDVAIEAREFGDWTMAHRGPREAADVYDAKMRRLLERASPDVSGSFLALLSHGDAPG